jgi:hypothetical protein
MKEWRRRAIGTPHGGGRGAFDGTCAERRGARRWPATLIGASSAASGVAMLLAPLELARLYALPRRRSLLRLLALRDVAIGLWLVGGDPDVGLRARMLSDLADLGLMLAAHPPLVRARRVRGRLAAALGSALLAYALQRNPRP